MSFHNERTADVVSGITEDNNQRYVAESFMWEWECDGTPLGVKVPEGFEFKISGSRLARAFIKLFGPTFAFERVVAVHDLLYKTKGRIHLSEQMNAEPFTRKQADAVMLSDPADPTWMQWIVYGSIRLFGKWVWEDDDEVPSLNRP